MRTGSIGVATGMLALAPVLSSLAGCDIGQRTRVESLYAQGVPVSIAVDQTTVYPETVYWNEMTTVEDAPYWTIKSVPKKALPPAPPSEPVQGPGRFFTVEAGASVDEGTTIWFADPAGQVTRRNKSGDLTMFTPSDATAAGLARDGSNIYELITLGNPQTEWQLWAIPRDESPPTMMASEMSDSLTPLDIVSDGGSVYFSLGGPVDQALVGEIRRVPVGTTDMETLAAGVHRPQVLREFGDNLFWYEVEEIRDTGLVKGRLQRTSKDGSESLVLASVTGSTSLSVDENFVYWVDTGEGKIWVERVPHGGSNSITSMIFLEPAGASNAIASDETYIYWSDQGAPQPGLNRMLKK